MPFPAAVGGPVDIGDREKVHRFWALCIAIDIIEDGSTLTGSKERPGPRGEKCEQFRYGIKFATDAAALPAQGSVEAASSGQKGDRIAAKLVHNIFNESSHICQLKFTLDFFVRVCPRRPFVDQVYNHNIYNSNI